MTKALLLLLSAALVAAGVFIVWRDVHRRRREAFLVRADPTAAQPEVEVIVAHLEPDLPMPRIAQSPAVSPARSPATDPASRWAALRPVLDTAVERVSGVLAGAGVTIGKPGKPAWSLLKSGYGVHRRILIGGDSVAWLRLELDADGRVQASVKAHKDDLAAINASASLPADGLNVARASDLLSECLKLAAAYAVSGSGGGAMSAMSAMSATSASPEQWAGETAWKVINPVVTAALRAANGALSEAGARFVPLGPPAWADDAQRHRLAVRVEVLGRDAARLHIEHVSEEVEIAVGLADARLAGLGRRERLPLSGLTTHALAELIASSTWPAIAHFREMQPLR